MEDSTLKTLLITNMVLLGFFILQQGISFLIHIVKKHKEQKEITSTDMGKDIVLVKVAVGKMEGQLHIIMTNLFVVQELQKDVNKVLGIMRVAGLIPKHDSDKF